MSAREALRCYLGKHDVPFELETHSLAYTAQELAHVEHVPGRFVAKVTMASAVNNGELFMLVLPSHELVDFGEISEVIRREVRLAHESEFEHAFPDCELGAMPPFGNLYHIPVYVEESLTKDDYIVFNAGSHAETMKIAYRDFARLVNPIVADFKLVREREYVGALD